MSDDENNEIMEKKFEFHLLLNWKNGSVKLYKRKPKSRKVSPYHIPIKATITVKVPKKTELHAKGEITMSKEKMDEMIIEEL